MKHTSHLKLSAIFTALVTFTGAAQAHPGHSALDWFTALPHVGHQNEYATLLTAVALTCAIFGVCWQASRQR